VELLQKDLPRETTSGALCPRCGGLISQGGGPSLSEKSLRHLTTISESAKRMGDLIDELLAFSRVGRAAVHKVDVNLDELVRETLGDFQAETKGRKIVWNIHPLPPVWADRTLLRLVLVNLISNAVKFTGIRAEARIEIGCAPGGLPRGVVGTGTPQRLAVLLHGAGGDGDFHSRQWRRFRSALCRQTVRHVSPQRLHSRDEFEARHRAGQRPADHSSAWRPDLGGSVVDGGATFYFSIARQNKASMDTNVGEQLKWRSAAMREASAAAVEYFIGV